MEKLVQARQQRHSLITQLFKKQDRLANMPVLFFCCKLNRIEDQR